MEKIDYVKQYYAAYLAMKEAATEAIKKYGKELDVVKAIKTRLMKENDYKSEDEIYEDELYDALLDKLYYCLYETKHEILVDARITKVRYNKKDDCIEAYLSSEDGFINGWYADYAVSHETESIYITILTYIE